MLPPADFKWQAWLIIKTKTGSVSSLDCQRSTTVKNSLHNPILRAVSEQKPNLVLCYCTVGWGNDGVRETQPTVRLPAHTVLLGGKPADTGHWSTSSARQKRRTPHVRSACWVSETNLAPARIRSRPGWVDWWRHSASRECFVCITGTVFASRSIIIYMIFIRNHVLSAHNETVPVLACHRLWRPRPSIPWTSEPICQTSGAGKRKSTV